MKLGKFEVVHRDEVVAITKGPYYRAKMDAFHYGMMYAQDGGPVMITDKSKRSVPKKKKRKPSSKRPA